MQCSEYQRKSIIISFDEITIMLIHYQNCQSTDYGLILTRQIDTFLFYQSTRPGQSAIRKTKNTPA